MPGQKRFALLAWGVTVVLSCSEAAPTVSAEAPAGSAPAADASGIDASGATDTGTSGRTDGGSPDRAAGDARPSPDADATPRPDGGSAECPAFPAFPDENCTGYAHTGTTLTDYTGPMKISTPGTVIEGKVLKGRLCIVANDVTIRRSKVEGVIEMGSGGAFGPCPSSAKPTNILIEDVEVMGPGTPTTHDVDISTTFPVNGSNYTCRRCNLHRWGNGFRVERNVTIEDSYVHDTIGFEGCSPRIGSDCLAHRSCIGGNGAIDSVYRHNRIDCTNLNGEGGVSGAIVIYSQRQFTEARNVRVEKNILSTTDASYCLYAGAGDIPPTNLQIIDNRFARVPLTRCGLYGPIVSEPGVILSGNAFTDGTPIQ